MSANIQAADADLLYGMAAVAAHIGSSKRQAGWLHEKGELPTFKIGGKVCARRSELEAHLARTSATAHRGPRHYGPRNPAGREEATPRQSASLTPQAAVASAPTAALLYGHRAIAAHLGMPAADVERLDVTRRLPTYQDDGCTVASTAALDHWNSMKGGAHGDL